MQPLPPDVPFVVGGVPVYVVPTCMVGSKLAVDNADPMYDTKYWDGLYLAISASMLPLSDQRIETVSKLLDLAQPSIVQGHVYQCSMGDVDILFVPLMVNGYPWYYTHWDKIITTTPRPQRTPEQRAKVTSAWQDANKQRTQAKDALQVEAELWRLYSKRPTYFKPDVDLFWLGQMAAGSGLDTLAQWLYKNYYRRDEFNAMLAKVHMATLSIPALKALLKANGQPVSGKKPDLVRRAQALPTDVQRAYLEAQT